MSSRGPFTSVGEENDKSSASEVSVGEILVLMRVRVCV